MSIVNLVQTIKKGKEGKNVGIKTGIPKLDSVIYGVQRKFLYTIGASSGIGKTSFTLDTFLFNVIKNAGDKPISVLFYSFEMSKEVLFAKLISRYIWETFKQVITYEDILSLTSPISDEKYEYIKKSIDWIKYLDSLVTVYDKPLSPSGIYGTCKDWLRKFGDFTQVGEHKETYDEHDTEMYKIVLIDHVGLIGGNESKKVKIDTVADYMIYFRNKCNITGVFVQQLNRGVSSVERKTNGFELIGLEDFKDSSGTTDASEVVIALYSPYREKIARCEGYPIQNVLKNRFLLVEIIKNRFGRSGVNIGTVFHGEINLFRELPLPTEISDYEEFINLNYVKPVENKEIDKKEFRF